MDEIMNFSRGSRKHAETYGFHLLLAASLTLDEVFYTMRWNMYDEGEILMITGVLNS